ncbi:tRNA uridine-5-carboxymethylaminomethyl(34) synthesis GTPase MnmE [Elioraea rosea]|uniref:tRNA uridine-5-carboxymethylaminomethyl(34) synthesis GTPase MnmE n=1 Tax=Elioraea rosea TaxID=2492390 RepID=UPI001EF48360|nr:tRNA uridine-5-carboxymethylaminomethyl(34) synthesis GTPase MnmE [Elioraea rosea]
MGRRAALPDAGTALGETIFALASGAGAAGVAVIRVSGPGASRAMEALAGLVPEPRRAVLRTLRHPKSGEAIDRAVVLRFAAPASFTGEEVAEFHVHGGRAVIEAVAGALLACGPGLRPAEPGEFSRRAFFNGKLDLTEAEGIADLVAAETEAQRRQALAQSGGALARQAAGWSARLARSLALAEAAIDFSDDGVGEEAEREALTDAEGVAAEMEAALAGGAFAERVREGFRIAIIGAPNAGKSSLLNRLAGREAAIVSSRAGTTRDVIEVRMDLGGYAVTLADMAGLRDAEDEVEAEGVRRALAWAGEADVLLAVFDGTAREPDQATVGALAASRAPWLAVSSRADLAQVVTAVLGRAPLPVSSRTGDGIGALGEALLAEIARLGQGLSGATLTRARHVAAVGEARAAILRAMAGHVPELRAEELRVAMHVLGRLTGRVDVEELLDIVFGSFCIGK